MTELYSNDNFKIIQKKNLFSIEFVYPNPVLCHSLVKTKILRGATILDDYKQVVFKAYSVQLFTEVANKSIYMGAAIIDCISSQLKYMANEFSVTFVGFNIENIIIIDGERFVFLDCDLINEIDDNNTIMISKPFKNSDFFVSPEMKRVTSLPSRVHYKTAYFSLGCLLLHTLLGKEIFDGFYQEYLLVENTNDILNKYLELLTCKDTKIYWLICRCLVEEPEKRSILFI